MQAVWKLARSGATTALGRRRGVLGDVSDRIRWTAGYVVAWVEDESFKRQTRARVLDAVVAEQPDFVLAHSLGSLVTYDAFSHADAGRSAAAAALRRSRYVTLGSQIGNPFVVKNLTPGRIEPVAVKYWHHLYNEEDDVFTAPIKLWDTNNFEQVDAPFDIDGFADHSAVEYLKHVNTIENVWRPVAEQRINARAFGAARARRESPAALTQKGRSQRRALLVGINEYPREEDRLEGCVNDVFLMSSVLQECGFAAGEHARLPRRAGHRPGHHRAAQVAARRSARRRRARVLLQRPRREDPGVRREHGAGPAGRDARALGLRLVADKAIVDDQIFALYSQLPYATRFAMILDCCHSGGMHRQGGARVRGLNAARRHPPSRAQVGLAQRHVGAA